MPKNTLILVGALILIAGGLFYFKSRPVEEEITLNPDVQTPAETLTQAQKFSQAISTGDPYHCELVNQNPDEDTPGTMTYQFMGPKMFMTIESPAGTQYMINDAVYLYTWNDQGQGSKFKLASLQELDQSPFPSPSNAPSFTTEEDYTALEEQGYSITCNPSDFGPELFVPPSNITFLDTSELMEAAIPQQGGSIDLENLQQMSEQYQNLNQPQ